MSEFILNKLLNLLGELREKKTTTRSVTGKCQEWLGDRWSYTDTWIFWACSVVGPNAFQ